MTEVRDKSDRAWKLLIDEAEDHAEVLRTVVGELKKDPRGNEETLRSLEYAHWCVRQHYRNLIHCQEVGRKLRLGEDSGE